MMGRRVYIEFALSYNRLIIEGVGTRNYIWHAYLIATLVKVRKDSNIIVIIN